MKERLNCDAIDVKPHDFNFGEGFTERWDLVYPDVEEWVIDECKQVCSNYGWDPLEEGAEEDDWHEYLRDRLVDDPDGFCPMMNYYYPIPGLGDAAKAQAALELAVLPVVVVLVDEEPVLALSGGGMDLSWEICEAYITLGYWPPVHFCNLPRMAGRGGSDRDKRIIRCCLESVRIAKRWGEGKERRLREMEENPE